MNIFLKILKGFFYYTTAIIFAVICTAGIYIGVAYYSYNNYYLDYISVQNKWVEVDKSYNNHIYVISKEFTEIKSKLDKKEWKEEDKEKQEEIKLKLIYIQNSIINMQNALTYEDKLVEYPNLKNTVKQLIEISNSIESSSHSQNLAQINITDTMQLIEEYNSKAQEWNSKMEKFPVYALADIASFHKWKTLTTY